MSNTFQNPIVLDTEGAGVLLGKQALHIKRIVWQSVTAGDIMTLQDGSGNVITTHTTTVNKETLHELIEHTFDGLIMADLDSGTVYVFLN